MVKSDTRLYKFGTFQLDSIKRVLIREDTPIQLPPRAFDVLLALVDHNEYVIDKDELMRMVWGERVVEENNLTRHISTLRKVFDEAPTDHRYIVTVPGRGYSFVAPVERVTGDQPAREKQNGKGSVVNNGTDRRREPIGPEPARQFDSSPQPQAISDSNVAFEVVPATRSRKRKVWLVAAVWIISLACSGVLVSRVVNIRSQPPALNTHRDWDVVTLTRTGGSISPDISPDGKYVAYVNREPGRSSIWIQQLATSSQQQLVPPDKFDYLDLLFSPDGSELYFTRTEGSTRLRCLYRMPALGGVATKLRDDVDSHIALSRDGTRICLTRRNSEGKSEFIITNADGAEERVLAHRPVEFPAWSPDGKVIAFSESTTESTSEDSIHEIRVDDATTREISAKRWGYISHKSWLPDGSGLIVCANAEKANTSQLWFVAYPSGHAHSLSNDLNRLNSIGLTQDAKMLVTEQVTAVCDIWSGPLADMASAKKIGVWGGSGLCILPDGRIVYSSPNNEGYSKMWIMNADGTQQKQLTSDDSNDVSFVASPDGRFIVFASSRTGYLEIWRMNTDGSNLVQLTNTRGASPPSISPDGRWVVYLASSDHHLYRVSIEGGESQRVSGKAVGISAVSPDAKLIGYIAPGKETWGINVDSFIDSSPVRRFEVNSHFLNNRTLKWTPDGKALLYSKQSEGVSNIWIQPVGGGSPRQVTDFKADGIFRFDISADGKNLVCARGGWKHDIVLIKNLR